MGHAGREDWKEGVKGKRGVRNCLRVIANADANSQSQTKSMLRRPQ